MHFYFTLDSIIIMSLEPKCMRQRACILIAWGGSFCQPSDRTIRPIRSNIHTILKITSVMLIHLHSQQSTYHIETKGKPLASRRGEGTSLSGFPSRKTYCSVVLGRGGGDLLTLNPLSRHLSLSRRMLNSGINGALHPLHRTHRCM